ncbi:MAG: glycosyltransferase family 2 protein [Candidatus Omnitrophica bacterium]|nr:glycosyltransferase family 2 protein [Candidatus Omnitrophota bacterium]
MTVTTCVLLPAYNAAKTIGPLVQQIKQLGYDAIVVDDGSTDDTAKLSTQAGAFVMSHVTNRGKGCALRTGIAFALRSSYTMIVTLDSDGQHDPADIPRLVAAAGGAPPAIAIGHRQFTREMPRNRRWTNRLMSGVISWLTRQRIPDSQCGFRAIPRELLTRLPLSSCRFELETELLLVAARRRIALVSVPIRTIYDQHTSHIHPLLDGWRFLCLIFRHLVKLPLPSSAHDAP